MPVTSNASPIIVLAKIGRLQLLKSLYGKVLISPFVKVESVDKGKELGALDALEIEKAINEGWIRAVGLTRRQDMRIRKLVNETKIGFGEAATIVLANDEKIMAILDDKEARAIAKSWGIQYSSTVMVLYEAFVKKLINFDELLEDLARLTKAMWISTDVITEVIKRAKKVIK